MASSQSLTMLLITIFILASLFFSSTTAIEEFDSTSFTTSTPPQASPPPPPPPPPSPQEAIQDYSFFSHTSILPPILSHLGFHELATAAPSLSDANPSTAWSGPSTLFAPSDSSIRTCFSCSIPNLLREHIVPGLFTTDYLRKLAFGTKIETLSPGHCVTVTSERSKNATAGSTNVFIGGVEITHPDLFNNGLFVVHGLQGLIAPLSAASCDVERITSLSFPFHADHAAAHQFQSSGQPSLMRFMLRDAMLRLRNNGFTVLGLALKVKYPELVTLNNMTIFAVDDATIFSGSQSYISNVRFHIVPNHFLTITDLERLPVGTSLPTLVSGQSLVVTTAGGGFTSAPMRINYVRIKIADVMRNLRIVVHSVFLPFPHVHPAPAMFDHIPAGGVPEPDGSDPVVTDRTVNGICDSEDGQGDCSEVPMAHDQTTSMEIEDRHGL